MPSIVAYFLIAAGLLTFLVSSFDKFRQSLPLKFAATMMVMAGLAILHYEMSEAPGL